MFEDMAVINEVTDIRPAKIHPDFDAGVRPLSAPVRHVGHIDILAIPERDSGLAF